MLAAYLPVLVFLALGVAVGLVFTAINGWLGPKRPSRIKSEPYECGLPSEVTSNFRFGISFYLIAMLFILFDIEVLLVFPVALELAEAGIGALVKIIIFVALLAVAFIHQWRRVALEWR